MLKRRFNMSADSLALNYGAGPVLSRISRVGIYLGAVLMLAACSNSGVSDLEAFVAKVKVGNPGKVEPLPELKPFKKYTYSAYLDDLKDPFVTWATINPKVDNAPKSSGENIGISPDGSRVKETLESYPLETLMMMGTLEYDSENWGLIKAPDGIIYRVKSGNYIGQNYGKISKVSDEDITLIEIVSDGLGGWENRPAGLSLNEE